VHAVRAPAVRNPALGQAVWRTSTFGFDSSDEYAAVLADTAPGYTYSRIDNPTVDAFAAAVAALEGHGATGEVRAQAFASGMAAITAALLANLHAGDHVVAPAGCYGGTWSLLSRVLSRFGVRTTFVDGGDPSAYAAAVTPETRVVWAETLSNPTMVVADLPALAAIARGADARLIVDSTFASPAVCRPLEHGADLVVHSATKYIGGHSDATGGVVAGAPDLIKDVRTVRIDTGGVLAPDEAFLLSRGLATLPLRMERHCATAAAVAQALAGHPNVERVDHPSLPSHRGHALARHLFDAGSSGTRFGAVIWVVPRGGRPAGMAFADGVRLAVTGASLGGTHTLIGHAASSTHRQLDDESLHAGGIDPAGVRISIGLEDADDLIADLTASLERLGS
jgi:cystathionine gamma-synthase/O-acetylhomoserine (thiol)-lyase